MSITQISADLRSRPALYIVVIVVMMALVSACREADPKFSDYGTKSVVSEQSLGVQPSPTYSAQERNVQSHPTKSAGLAPTTLIEATPNANVPISISTTVDFAPPPTAEQIVDWYGLIVTGHVVEVLPSQWSTPDRKRPANAYEALARKDFVIITPVVVEIDSPAIVNRYNANVSPNAPDPAHRRVVLATLGGDVGQDRWEVDDPTQRFVVGERVLVALTNRPKFKADHEEQYATPAGLSWSVGMKWVLTSDGQALPAHPQDKPQPAALLISNLKAVSHTP